VAVDLDHGKFWNLVTDALVRIGDVDPSSPVSVDAGAANS
jgi:purine nucleosidase